MVLQFAAALQHRLRAMHVPARSPGAGVGPHQAPSTSRAATATELPTAKLSATRLQRSFLSTARLSATELSLVRTPGRQCVGLQAVPWGVSGPVLWRGTPNALPSRVHVGQVPAPTFISATISPHRASQWPVHRWVQGVFTLDLLEGIDVILGQRSVHLVLNAPRNISTLRSRSPALSLCSASSNTATPSPVMSTHTSVPVYEKN